MKTTEFLF